MGFELADFLERLLVIGIREDDDRDIAELRISSELGQDFETILLGHLEVEDNRVRHMLANERDTFFAILGEYRIKILSVQIEEIYFAQVSIIIDNANLVTIEWLITHANSISLLKETSQGIMKPPPMPWNQLTTEEARIIVGRGTEVPFSGEYDSLFTRGTYLCRRCNAPLYDAKTKFDAGCGWPAFDDNFPGAVKRLTDADGHRIEIRCAHCDAHLGHIFEGERLTEKDTRHCVNSLSMRFVPVDEDFPPILDKE